MANEGNSQAGVASAAQAAGAIPQKAIDALLAAQGEVEPLDTGSVMLGVKKPQGSNYLRAIELADGNTNLVPFVEALLCISTVDGTPQATIRSKAQMYALADKVGRSSMDSLIMWFQHKAMPELGEIIAENPEVPVGSPEFQALLAAKRAVKAKK